MQRVGACSFQNIFCSVQVLEVYGISVDLPSSSTPLPTRASKDANDGAAGDTMDDDASDAGSDDYAYESMDEVCISIMVSYG